MVTQALPRDELRQAEAEVPGICIRRVGSRSALQRAPRLGQVSFLAGAICCALRSRPNAVVTLQLGAATTAGALLSRILAVPHIVRLTGGGTAEFRSEPMARTASRLGRAVQRLVDNQRTTVVAPAQHLLDDFREAFPQSNHRMVCIPNGIPTPVGDAAQWSERRGVAWYSRSGSTQSSRLFHSVAAALPHIPFTVFGATYSEPALPNVEVLGWQKHPELVLRSKRVLLNTSPHEGMPNTALQAIAEGCVVVGLENRGMAELRSMHPEHVRTANMDSLSATLEVAVESEMPGPGRVATMEDVAQKWFELLNEGGGEE